jgi:hypothetical protein
MLIWQDYGGEVGIVAMSAMTGQPRAEDPWRSIKYLNDSHSIGLYKKKLKLKK